MRAAVRLPQVHLLTLEEEVQNHSPHGRPDWPERLHSSDSGVHACMSCKEEHTTTIQQHTQRYEQVVHGLDDCGMWNVECGMWNVTLTGAVTPLSPSTYSTTEQMHEKSPSYTTSSSLSSYPLLPNPLQRLIPRCHQENFHPI